jgi:uncharacterized repeat protein (TIGR03943 family)
LRDRFLSHGLGLLLVLVGVATIVWLALSGRLGLYIHPRYFEFTVIMAVVAGVEAIVAAAFLPRAAREADELGAEHDDHGHTHPSGRRATWLTVASIALIVVTTAAMLVVPPSTLTSDTVAQRDINASAGGAADAGNAPALVAGDGSAVTGKDWAGLLRQGADEHYLADALPDVTGFVTPDPDDPENVFYVARFVVTCCAVDAQPVGVPVYLPGWSEQHPIDSWVQVTGRFVVNPSATSMQPLAIDPAQVAPIEQPADPYVY